MLCLKNYHRIGFGIFLSVFFAVLSVFFFSDTNVSAVSDISVTYDSSTPLSDWQDVFPTCTEHCLDDYHYLLVSSSSRPNLIWTFNGLRFRFDGSSVVNQGAFNTPISFLIFELSFDGHNNNLLQFYSPYTYSFSVTYTLTESLSPGSPSGSITLSQNGTYDVSSYAEAVVDVPPTIEPGDYHDDLVSINNSILICAAVCLVIYFFYCIYRMIIKTTGGYL